MAETLETTDSKTASTGQRPDAKVMVELRELHKIYDAGVNAVHALRGLNIDVLDGEYMAIMGASGSGKSTLLNILGALDVPSNGTFRLAGQLTA